MFHRPVEGFTCNSGRVVPSIAICEKGRITSYVNKGTLSLVCVDRVTGN